jgi:hypothetical protein
MTRIDRIGTSPVHSDILLVFGLSPKGIPKMEYGQDRMPEEHTRPGVAHNGANPLPHFGLVTVDRAFFTRGFALLEGAFVQVIEGVLQEFLALGAEHALRRVMFFAVEADHGLYCFSFPDHAGMQICCLCVFFHCPYLVHCRTRSSHPGCSRERAIESPIGSAVQMLWMESGEGRPPSLQESQ